MPIRLNLLREVQAADEERRKDPVKRAILGGVVLVGLVFAWSSVLQLRVMRAGSELARVQGKWHDIEKTYKAAVENRRLAAEADDHLVALQRYTTNRFLWGTCLNELQHLLAGTEGINVVRVRGEQNFNVTPEVKPKPGQGAPKPATSTEKTVLTIEARDYSSQPGDQVTKLKGFLALHAIPGAPSAGVSNQVSLLNISAPQTDKDGSASYVTFSLQSTYPEKTRQ
ncbi:MAG TPA: hypothetical protein DCM86_20065 [Verrucomicrobiales bacterium]|nr:hypothetical protein [Verrucomicrobiales bacterium]